MATTSPARPAGPSPVLPSRSRSHSSPDGNQSQSVRWLPFTTVLPPPTYVRGMKMPDVEDEEGDQGKSVPLGELRGKLRIELRTLSLPLALPKRETPSPSSDQPNSPFFTSSTSSSPTSSYSGGSSLQPAKSPPLPSNSPARRTRKDADDEHDHEVGFMPRPPRSLKLPVFGLTRKLSKSERKKEEDRRRQGVKSCLKSPASDDGPASPFQLSSKLDEEEADDGEKDEEEKEVLNPVSTLTLEKVDPSLAVAPEDVATHLRLERTPSASVARLRECCPECHSGLLDPSCTPVHHHVAASPASSPRPLATPLEVVDETAPEVHWSEGARKAYEDGKLRRELRIRAGLTAAPTTKDWEDALSGQRKPAGATK